MVGAYGLVGQGKDCGGKHDGRQSRHEKEGARKGERKEKGRKRAEAEAKKTQIKLETRNKRGKEERE